MSARTALNKDLIMRRVSGRHQALTATLSTSPSTDSDTTVHPSPPHESDVQPSTVFSDVLARVESGFNNLRIVTHDPNARLATISAVDKEVEAARQLLRSLLSRRNGLAPISLLPPEILARVFYFLTLQEPPYSSKQNLGWIRATHVCRHWRQVALDDSSLWGRILGYPTNTAWISEMLTRARNAPLDIIATPNSEVLLMLPQHLSHTRTLRLRSLSTSDSDSIRHIFSREAPVLEDFELWASLTSPIAFRDLGGKMLFKGHAPKLRTFSLSHALIPWSLIPRGQLTQLKIVLFNEASTADVTSFCDAGQFIDLLANCSSLEILVLKLCLPSNLSEFSHNRTIHLPRLSRLCVGGASSRVTNLLRMLGLPSTTILHLQCFSENGSSHNDYQVLPLVSAHFQSSVSVEFKSLSVTLSSMGRMLEVAASVSLPASIVRPSRDRDTDVDEEVEFVLSFNGLAGIRHWKDILERVCKMLPISNLEFLSISDPDTIDSINWAELFKRCTNVSTIRAIGNGTSSLIRSLTPPKPTNANSKRGKKRKGVDRGTGSTLGQAAENTVVGAQAPIFPKLTSLFLEKLDFTETKPYSGTLYDVFAHGLRLRNSTYQIPVKTIHVDHCTIPFRRASSLERLVPDFRWDREEGSMNEFDDFDEFDDYDSDFIEPGARWEDFFIGTTQAEWDWWENYSDD